MYYSHHLSPLPLPCMPDIYTTHNHSIPNSEVGLEVRVIVIVEASPVNVVFLLATDSTEHDADNSTDELQHREDVRPSHAVVVTLASACNTINWINSRTAISRANAPLQELACML